MVKTQLFWLGVSAAAIAAGASVWLPAEAPETEEQATEIEKRDCGINFLPAAAKEKLRPECL